MPNNSDIGTKMRVLQLLCLLVERPKVYKIKALANKYACDEYACDKYMCLMFFVSCFLSMILRSEGKKYWLLFKFH